MTFQFAISAKPYPSESLRSWLAGIATLNDYPELFKPSMASLKSATTEATKYFNQSSFAIELLNRVGWHISQQSSHPDIVHIGNSKVFSLCVRTVTRAICSECFKNEPYSRCEWELNLVKACSIHKTLLILACPDCHRKLRWSNTVSHACGCGFQFIHAHCVKAPHSFVEIAKQVNHAFQISITGSPEFVGTSASRPLNLEEYLLAVEVLTHVVLPKFLPGKLPTASLLEYVAVILSDPLYCTYLRESISNDAKLLPRPTLLLPGRLAAEIRQQHHSSARELTVPPMLREYQRDMLFRAVMNVKPFDSA